MIRTLIHDLFFEIPSEKTNFEWKKEATRALCRPSSRWARFFQSVRFWKKNSEQKYQASNFTRPAFFFFFQSCFRPDLQRYSRIRSFVCCLFFKCQNRILPFFIRFCLGGNLMKKQRVKGISVRLSSGVLNSQKSQIFSCNSTKWDLLYLFLTLRLFSK